MSLKFSDIYNQLMLMVNRPTSETSVLTGAKWEINQAIKYLQRNHAYRYTETISEFTYQPSTLWVDLGTICGGLLRDVLSIQQLNTSGKPEGRPLQIVSYTQLQQMRAHFARTHSRLDDWYAPLNCDDYAITIEDAFRRDRIAFVSGQNIGIYPMVQESATYMINCHIWMKPLILDSDTNFFLDFASDVVLMKALMRMHIYMKTDARFQVTQEEFTECLSTLIAWDSQVNETPNTLLAGRTS